MLSHGYQVSTLSTDGKEHHRLGQNEDVFFENCPVTTSNRRYILSREGRVRLGGRK
jgi:hypothetical protein